MQFRSKVLTSSTALNTRTKFCLEIFLISSSEYPRRINSANKDGYFETSSRPRGVLFQKMPFNRKICNYLLKVHFPNWPRYAVKVTPYANMIYPSHWAYVVNVICEQGHFLLESVEEPFNRAPTSHMVQSYVFRISAINKIGIEVNHDYTTILCLYTKVRTYSPCLEHMYTHQHFKNIIWYVPGVVTKCSCWWMAEHDRGFWCSYGIFHSRHIHMRDVHYHTQTIHLLNNSLQVCKSAYIKII